MKLKKVRICNFRSIKDIVIDFENKCRAFVGINESGKTNILRALSLLQKEIIPNKNNDLREALRDEDPITSSFVRFIFHLDESEIENLRQSVYSRVLLKDNNTCFFVLKDEEYTLERYCAMLDEGIYEVSILAQKKYFTYWVLNRNAVIKNWKKPSKLCPAAFEVEINGKKVKLVDYKLISPEFIGEIPVGYLADVKFEDIDSFIGVKLGELTEKNFQNAITDIIYWEYTEANLLPNQIVIDEFSSNPDLCIPLKNMFLLAGITDIKKSLDEVKNGSSNQFHSYLQKIANKTTDHFRDVWKEYKDIEFSLNLNGDKIIPGIKEQNIHDFTRRSDGFKRFVTFLLMVSVNVKTNKLRNTLLLMDEPEIGLHPSGIRYLRDELIKISETNYVAYCTHSIFMIDTIEIDRNYIVKKQNEITTIDEAESGNIAEEEVLFNALGYSVFETLKEKNIIFEGWNDKRLFAVCLEGANKTLAKKFGVIGICHANGVKSMRNITPLLELAKRQCLIISDNDNIAKEHKKQYEQDNGYGEWKTYQDIDSSIEAVTGEDFIKNDFIIEQVNMCISGLTLPKFEVKHLKSKKNKIAIITQWLTSNGCDSSIVKDKIFEIKKSIFANLSYENVDHEYYKLLRGIII
jgi:predicted ATP-dependent endonuclease of OLD family